MLIHFAFFKLLIKHLVFNMSTEDRKKLMFYGGKTGQDTLVSDVLICSPERYPSVINRTVDFVVVDL